MSASPAPLYTLRRVVKTRRSRDQGFTLEVETLELATGGAFAIVGESGVGKSTLLDLLAFALDPDDGIELSFTDRAGTSIDILALWRERRGSRLARLRASECGYVLQTGGLLPFLSVFDNIALAQRLNRRLEPERVHAIAARLDVARHLRKLPAQLSIGQRQRVSIARALAHRPRVVLADEPTASIHPALAEEIFELLIAQTREAGATLILATHEVERARRWGLVPIGCTLAEQPGLTISRFGFAQQHAEPPIHAAVA